jgi:hypothetical protein
MVSAIDLFLEPTERRRPVPKDLEESRVDKVPELVLRNAVNLVAKMEEEKAKKNLVRRTPTEKMVEKWIAQANKLLKVVSQ